MARTKQTIDDRIKKAEEAVIKTKEKYEAELIMMFLNQWDTACGADKDFRFYQVEAEEIAQKTRKNSTLETVA